MSNGEMVVRDAEFVTIADERSRGDKVAWNRNHRRVFAAKNGYSTASHYATGGLRKQVLERDGYKCVRCGMTDAQHKDKWGSRRPITVDHKNKNRRENTMENLQTLCLSCHGNKDLIPRLRALRIPQHKTEIIARRVRGQTYQSIADDLGFSLTGIYTWLKRWEAA